MNSMNDAPFDGHSHFAPGKTPRENDQQKVTTALRFTQADIETKQKSFKSLGNGSRYDKCGQYTKSLQTLEVLLYALF